MMVRNRAGRCYRGRDAREVVEAMREGSHDPGRSFEAYVDDVAGRARELGEDVADPGGDPGLLLAELLRVGWLRTAPEPV